MEIITNERINFNSLEEKTYKKMMELGRSIIQEDLRMIDKLIKDCRDKEIFECKDMQPTTLKTKLGEIPISRRRYKMVINGKVKWVYLLDEFLQINEFGLYSQSIVEMVAREITKKSYRETAKTISEDTENTISHTAVRNIVLKLCEKIKNIEEEKIKLYEEGKIEGNRTAEYVFCEHDGIYIKKQKSKHEKGKKKAKIKHFKKKKNKKKKNGMEVKIAVIHEGKEPRYSNDFKLKNKTIVGTIDSSKELKRIEDATIGTTYKEYKIKNIIINGDGADWTGNIVEGTKEIFQLDMAHIQKKIYMAVSNEEYLKKMQEIVYTEKSEDIFSLIYNYKVELETDNKQEELKRIKELEEYLKNNKEGILRYQYKLGYKEEEFKEMEEKLPSLGSEESQMYCVCRDRMKKNRTSWSSRGAEAILKVIMSKMNETLEEILSNKAEEKIKKELAERIAEPIKINKKKQGKIIYAGKYQIASNFTESTKQYVKDVLRGKKCSELMLIN